MDTASPSIHSRRDRRADPWRRRAGDSHRREEPPLRTVRRGRRRHGVSSRRRGGERSPSADLIVAPILGVDAPVIHIAEKSRLYERFGAAVVDMESHLAAAAASAHRLPLAAVRVVADDARCGLPDAAVAGRRVDGSIDAPAVLRALLDNPSDLAPLIRLAAQTHLARAKLLSLSQSLGGRMGLPFP